MKFNKIILSALLVFSMFNIQLNNEVEAKESVVIDEGTDTAFTVPADSSKVVEDGLEDGFVQGDSVKFNFEKVNLEGFSLDERTTVIGTKALDDGTFIVVVSRSNVGLQINGTHSVFILNVDINGIVLKSLCVSTGYKGSKLSAITAGGSTTKASYPTASFSEDKVYVSYVGRRSGSSSGDISWIFSSDYNIDGKSSKWVYPGNFSNSNGMKFTYSYNINEYDEETGEYVFKGRKLGYSNSDANATSHTVSYMDVLNEKHEKTVPLEVRPVSQMEVGQTDGNRGFLVVSNPTELANGGMLGISRAFINGTWATDLNVWDTSGNLVYTYALEYKAEYKALLEISTENEIYFMEGYEFLKKINVETGEVTTVKTYPIGTSITIEKDEKSDDYIFYGYAGDNTGEFAGYGTQSGAIIGSMDNKFNVLSAGIISTDSAISINLKRSSEGEIFAYGNLKGSKTFANKPTSQTNGYNGQGWYNKSELADDTYFGSLKQVDDYSPAIKVGDTKTIITSDYADTKEIEKEILSDIEVYDSFEFDVNNPSNGGLTEQNIYDRLHKKINVNPKNTDAPIDWKSLGLDISKAGYNRTKFFITDTNNQTTADSKGINVIKDTTAQNGKVALDASNFHIEKSEAASLDLAKAKTNANATAWDMLDGTNLDSSITVNAGELAAINIATEDGVYNLTFTATNGTDSISNTIKVYVGGNYDPNSKVVLFGNDFGVLLEEAPTYTEAEALVDSDARAYNIETEELLDKDNLSADVAAINAATKSGIYAASVSYNDANVSLTDDVNVRICTATCVDIVANHFNLTINEVASLTEEKIITLAGAKAHDLITGDKHNISVDFGKIHAIPGSYDVTFTSKNNSSITVKATVGNNLVTDDTRAIAADDVVMSAKELKALKNDRDALNAELLDRSNAKAWIIETNETLDGIVVDSNSFDFADLKADTYKIKYTHIDTATSNPITTSANLTVDDGGTVIGDYDVIDANDFALAASEVEGLTEEKVIELAHARAWLLEDGSDVKITDVDYSNIEAKQGIYDVTFTSEYGTSTTIYAFVGKDNRPIIDEDKNIVVFANDYSVDTKNLDGMTKTDHIEAANAMAVDKDTHEELELSHVDISSIKNEAGKYSASFGVDISKTKTKSTDIVKSVVTVTVVDSSTDGGLVQTGMVSYAFALALLACGLLLVRREKNRKRV